MSRLLMLSLVKNPLFILLLKDSGELFAWGSDIDNTGILGLGDIKHTESPVKVQF